MPPTIETMPIIFGESICGVPNLIMSTASDYNYLEKYTLPTLLKP
jgi:hypothetical protein